MKYSLGDRVPVLEGSDHFIADGARVIGRVRLKSHSSVWFNAVLHGCTIGKNTLIGIGSTILNGAPARVARQLSEEEIASLGTAAEHYVSNAARYRNELKSSD